MEATIEMLPRGPARLFAGMFIRWYGTSWNQGMINLKRMMESGELQP